MRVLFLLFSVLTLISCEDRDLRTSPEYIFQNVIVLLDLSNRIKKPNQIERDKAVIKSVLKVFEDNQKKFRYQISKDKLSIALAYQSSSGVNLFPFGDEVVIDMEIRPSSNMNRPIFDEKKEKFQAAIDSLYDLAADSEMNGADIWSFFCTDLKNYYQSDMDNKVIILTDGYLMFDRSLTRKRATGTYMEGFSQLRNKKNWSEIFEKKNMKLNICEDTIADNVEVAIFEVNPRDKEKNTNEYQIIERYWETWFDEMGIEANIYPTEDITSSKEDKIKSFLKREEKVSSDSTSVN